MTATAPRPLRQRPLDAALVAFFLLNILFVAPSVDYAQLFVRDLAAEPAGFWPPRQTLDTLLWWGRNAEPAALSRPVWWRACITLDAFLFGPFYVAAVWAFVKGREWIRTPAIVWAAMEATTILVILAEDFWGTPASPSPGLAVLGNLPWLVFPALAIARAGRRGPLFPPADGR